MALPSTNGVVDTANNAITGPNTGTWSQLGSGTDIATWDEWNIWSTTPSTLTWTTDTLDLGSIQDFNLEVEIEAQGTATYTVYTSTTGAFAGEEVSTVISAGDSNIAAFRGRYAAVIISVPYDSSQGVPQINSVSLRASTTNFNILLTDLNTIDLAGSVSQGFTLDLGRIVSKVRSMRITPLSPEPYFTTDYVATDYIGEPVPAIPSIKDKDRTSPKVTFITDTGTFTNSSFDVEVNVMAEQYVDSNGNLTIR